MQDPRLPEPLTTEGSGGIDIRSIQRVLLKYLWPIIGLTLLITVLSMLMVMRQTPIYQSSSTLLIERSPVSVSPVGDPYAAYTEHYLYYQTQYGLIKRRAIAERVVNALGMVTEPAPAPVNPEARESFTWKSLFPDDWFPEPEPPTAEERYQGAISGVLGSININPRRNSQLVDIAIQSADPEKAAQIANAVAEAFIQDNLAGRVDMAENATSYLTDRLQELQDKLRRSEQALQAYRDEEKLVDSSGVDSFANQEMSLAATKLAENRRVRAQAEAVFDQIEAARKIPGRDLAAIPAVLEHPQMQTVMAEVTVAQRRVDELARRYGPQWPALIDAQNQLAAAQAARDQRLEIVIGGIESAYRVAVAQERAAVGDLEDAKGELRSLDRKEFTLQTLEREVETNRQIFEKFQTQFKETDARGDVQTANARIVETARPSYTPIKPNKRRSVTMAFFLGLALSVGLAFLLEHLDNTLKGAEDAERKLGIPVLGLLPKLDTKDSKDLGPLRQFSNSPKSVFSEAVRTIRTGVLLSGIDGQQKVILVTSSVPGEGKTTLSMNLSRALSEMRNVLLIDADMRRPMVAKALDKNRQSKGLSHFISGEATTVEAMHKLSDRLYVMPAGVIPPNPLELLSSARFEDALSKLSERFDHIVIDCAPTLAVSDAMVLSKFASGVVYVIRSDSTPTQAAQDGIKRLRRAGANIIGAVVNRTLRKRKSYYGKYSYYYGDSYYTDYGYVTNEKRKKSGRRK